MDELTFPRPDDLTDEEWATLSDDLEAYADQRLHKVVAARAFAPRAVAHSIEADEDGGTHDTVTECPDCSRGLIADGILLICASLRSDGVDFRGAAVGATLHDIIACGRT